MEVPCDDELYRLRLYERFTPGHGWCPAEFRITLDDKLPIDYYIDWMRLYQKDGEEMRTF